MPREPTQIEKVAVRMAENNRTRGYRANDPYGRARSTAAQPAGDPLAELARLIGQQNETVPPSRQESSRQESSRQDAVPPSRQESVQPSRQSGQSVARDPQDPYGFRRALMADIAPKSKPTPSQESYGAAAPQAGYPDTQSGYPNADYPDAYNDQQNAYGAQNAHNAYDQNAYDQNAYGDAQYDPRYDTNTQYPNAQYSDPNYGHYAPSQDDSRYADSNYRDQRYQDQRDSDPRYAGYDANAGYPAGQGYADPNAAPYGYAQDQGQYADQAGYSQAGHSQQAGYSQYADGQQGYSDPSYNQGGYAQPGYAPSGYGQQAYDDTSYGQMPQAVTRPIGDEPPSRRRGGMVTVLAILALAVVGTASAFGYRAMFGTSGTAVPPPVIQADTNPSKVVPATDPNAKPIQDRVGAQAEKIVPREEKPIELRDTARAGTPRVVFPNLAGQGPAANVAPPGAASAPAPSEPKRIRTVTIKPDQGNEAPAPAPRSAQTRSGAPTTVDDILNGAPSQTAPSSNGPLALSPTTQPQAHTPPPAQPQQRQAARTTSSGSPFPAPITTGTSGAAAAGAYAVQVTSQRTEADAQASYRSLQQQFPSVLGSKQPVIRRADLGAKGTYYRAQVPFGTQGEASEFCSSLKSAGGQCVVQRN